MFFIWYWNMWLKCMLFWLFGDGQRISEKLLLRAAVPSSRISIFPLFICVHRCMIQGNNTEKLHGFSVDFISSLLIPGECVCVQVCVGWVCLKSIWFTTIHWSKRIWTLEEKLNSTSLCFIWHSQQVKLQPTVKVLFIEHVGTLLFYLHALLTCIVLFSIHGLVACREPQTRGLSRFKLPVMQTSPKRPLLSLEAAKEQYPRSKFPWPPDSLV